MRFTEIAPPRRFRAGRLAEVEISDTGRVALEPDEQVTFTTPAGGELDVTRKSWGFYATPSVNHRLRRFGLRACIATNPEGQRFVLLVEDGCEAEFEAYRADQGLTVDWMDP